jgi:predicted PurR-regulated permease PerM
MQDLQPVASADRPAGDQPPGQHPPGVSDFVRLGTLAVITAALVVLSLLLIVPFLPGVTWGIALAIIAYPIDRAIARRFGNRTFSAVVSTLLVTALILVPGLFVAYRLAREAATAAEKIQEATSEVGRFKSLAELPGMSQVVPWLDRFGVDLEQQVRSFIGAHTQDVARLTQGSAAAVIQFLLTIFILYYLFRDRERFLDGLRELLPLSRVESDQVFAGAADSVHANLRAAVITSAIDSTAGGLVFWAVGLPAPILWAAVMFILALLPILGAALIWVPAALYLMATGKWLGATAILATGITCFVFVDNLLFSRLAGERMRMHPALTLVAFLGGIALFGTSGMVLGPATFAVTLATIEVWRRRLRRNAAAGINDQGGLVIVSQDV